MPTRTSINTLYVCIYFIHGYLQLSTNTILSQDGVQRGRARDRRGGQQLLPQLQHDAARRHGQSDQHI